MKDNRRQICILGIVVILFPLLYGFVYQFNNKYRYRSAKPKEGVLYLTETVYDENSLFFLTEDWAFYSGNLYEPDDFLRGDTIDPLYITIGQYSGYKRIKAEEETQNQGTYRMRIFMDHQRERQYMLEIPEISSSYNLWVNGEHVVFYGEEEFKRYRPEIANNYITFKAEGEIEIIFAVNDYNHKARGILSPPAFGSVGRVSSYIIINAAATAMFFSIGMIVGTLYIASVVWAAKKFYSVCIGIMCYCFAWISSYPLVHFINIPHMDRWYFLRDFFFYTMLVSVLYLHTKVFELKTPLKKIMLSLSVFFCVASLFLPGLLGQASYEARRIYEFIVIFYKTAVIIYLLCYSFRPLIKNLTLSTSMVLSVYIFSIALLADFYLPFFEPVYLDFTNQMAGLAFVVPFLLVMHKETLAMHHTKQDAVLKNAVLKETARLTQNQLILQQQQYRLLAENIEQAKAARHDLRHHLSLIKSYIDKSEYDNLKKYVEEYHDFLAVENNLVFCENTAVSAVISYYYEWAAKYGISFETDICLPNEIKISSLDLCIIFGNCLENAMEANIKLSQENRFIKATARCETHFLSIQFQNSFSGLVRKRKDLYLSQKKGRKNTMALGSSHYSGKGIGISSVKAVVNKYNGACEFKNVGHTFEVTIFLQIPQEQMASD